MLPPPLSFLLPTFAAVDEGLDRILLFKRDSGEVVWSYPLKDKCRSLQWLPSGLLLAVCDTGYLEIDCHTGKLRHELRVADMGVVSAERLTSGHTFLGGVGLTGANAIEFLEVDSVGTLLRSTRFPGDYVRRSTATWENTILFTCDTCVKEGDWAGRLVRQISIPGFTHAWKALRAADGTTFISAGYGAFIVQCDRDGHELQRWHCTSDKKEIRPFFFGDFTLLPNGGLLVCNWLGHGSDLGASGYSLLEFAADGALVGAWRDSKHTSSLQTFDLAP
jgi:hypothetical protein